MNLSQSVTISEQVVFHEVSGETVLLDLESENYFGLDEVGTRIWQLLADGRSLQSVFDTALAEFDVDAVRLESDLDHLLTELQTQGLISLA